MNMEEKNKDKKGMEEKQRKTVNMLTLAFAIAFMPQSGLCWPPS